MKNDLLSRQEYLELLESIIENQKNNHSSYSFAIDGEWGSGKTWILDKLEELLVNKEKDKYLIFRYNAWENDYYEEPLIAIISVIIAKLNNVTSQKSLYESAINELLSTALYDLKLLVCGIVQDITKFDLEKSLTKKKGLFKRIKQGTKISNNEVDTFIPLQNKLKIVRDNLSILSTKFNIILFVDELDRCLPEYAIKVLERLHHICKDIPIIQILAINKANIADSISKVFGKDFSNTDNPKAYSNLFAESYLQKFVDVIIPLTNGKLENKLEVLNDLDKDFEEYIRKDITEIDNIQVDKEFLTFVISKLFTGLERRQQEKIISLTKMCHKITINSGTKLDFYSYAILIYEIISCICRYVFHLSETCKISVGRELFQLSFYQGIGGTKHPEKTNNKQINKQLIDMFNYGVIYTDSYNHQRIAFEIVNTKTFIMAYFFHQEVKSLNPAINGLWNYIEKDKQFLAKFDEYMNMLIIKNSIVINEITETKVY